MSGVKINIIIIIIIIVRYQTVAGDEVSPVRNVTERYGPATLCHIAAVSRCEASNSVGTAVGRFHIAVLCEYLCMYIIQVYYR